jgi:hypothetical protein
MDRKKRLERLAMDVKPRQKAFRGFLPGKTTPRDLHQVGSGCNG